ncbi:hypothetical protein [Streptomyces mutomycini]|uniref:Peptidoglycan-binding protein n=1 Tax=Streptomyces mutomycini TaxID=284036 RepID=A0ABW0AY50_9ACTN|nr:hypothetical protein [Streptomyces mutomycini]
MPHFRTLLVASLAAPLLLTAGVAESAPAKYTHAAAAKQFRAAGVSWSSSGNCSDWNKGTCTSFTNINRTTVAGAIAFKKASRCAVVITGGTERGHSSGTYSHRNGYKVDMSVKQPCLDNWIKGHYKAAGKRSDGARLYKSPNGNVYAREGSHWDATYYNGKA